MARFLVLGANGFIGSHLTSSLVNHGHHVIGVDIQENKFRESTSSIDIRLDLRDTAETKSLFNQNYDGIYQFAADMGGAGYINAGNDDCDISSNSVLVNANIIRFCKQSNPKFVFFASTACVYPEHNQVDKDSVICSEGSEYPASPDTEYGWEKLFSERMYLSLTRNYGINTKIARFHNVFGPFCSWNDGKEKAPAAICRKVAQAENNNSIEIWGDGEQCRSFLYIDEAVEAIYRLVESKSFNGPVNIGSEQIISINQLVDIVCKIAGKNLNKIHIPGPVGVLARRSDNSLIKKELNWAPAEDLVSGLTKTYEWIKSNV